MYYGENHTSIDEKGRLNVPKDIRVLMETQDHDTWFMTRGFDGAVFMFEKTEWNKLIDAGKDAPMLDPKMLDFRRFFLGSVAKVKRDSQGRFTIPAYLRQYAGIDRDAVLLGVEDHLELWGKENWRAFQAQQANDYKAMAAELFGGRSSDDANINGAA